MAGLGSSRWAPAQRSALQSTQPSAADELARHQRLLRRLQWKLPYLADSHRRATSPDIATAERAEAELMFKLDFYEYYVLLERALLHLLAVFGVTVSRHAPRIGPTTAFQSDHQFHANVLSTLDDPGNPLHPVLGQKQVRRHLAAAKELRNRWKYADDFESPPPLSAYEIEEMLGVIFQAFGAAQELAVQRVEALEAEGKEGQNRSELDGRRGSTGEAMELDGESVPWESVQNVMDWEMVL